jgi:hypothetical protein
MLTVLDAENLEPEASRAAWQSWGPLIVNLESIIEDGVVNEHPSFDPRHDPRPRSPKPTWWGIVVSICSLLAAIAVVAIGRGWL